jgi:quercetin dioxygenase-like cupin family protein
MNIYKTTDNPKKEFPGNVTGSLFPPSFKMQCVEMTLAPGGILPTHSKDTNALFYVIKGEVTVIIGDEKSNATPGTLIESPLSQMHGLENNSGSEAKVLFIKQHA